MHSRLKILVFQCNFTFTCAQQNEQAGPPARYSDSCRLLCVCFLCSISAWDARDGKLVRVFKGHAHWVNTLALSSEAALRTGAFDHKGNAPKDLQEAKEAAEAR